ncbi:MAG TPA: HU family DNA-binding protein [bacterium]|nr:HU family DNA-binding protein [bacterium]HOL48296.1 HU family DNA-binding protein [bacterium]HPQ19377.1 HU family DNA-binding protein [bacterium]
MAKVAYPEKFNASSLIKFVAEKTDSSKRLVKDIIGAYLDAVTQGVMSGQRVPVGNIGRFFVKVKPATKKRQGINPLTKEPITIPAKPARKVPKCSFSKQFKEAAKKAKI